MKKSRISLILLSTISIGALVGCGDKKPTTTAPITTPPTTSAVTPTTPSVDEGVGSIKELLETYFTGEYGKFKDDYVLTLKPGAADIVHTLTVTWVTGGEARYFDNGAQGYITDDSGAYMAVHTLDASKHQYFKTEIAPGVKIKITGKVAAYHGYAQFAAGWTYEIVEEAPEDPSSLDALFEEVTIADIIDTDKQIKASYMTKPILLKNMVLVNSSWEFVALEDINKEDPESIAIYGYKEQDTAVTPGKVYDIYAFTTAYKGEAQLHVHPGYAAQKFEGLRAVKADSLTPEQNLTLQSIYTSGASLSSKISFDYRDAKNPPVANRTTLLLPYNSDIIVSYAVVKGNKVVTDAIIGGDEYTKNLTVNPISDLEPYKDLYEIEEEVTLKSRVCFATAAGAEKDCFKVEDTSKYIEETKTIKVEHILKDRPSEPSQKVEGTLVKSMPGSIRYVTNNETYPDPSFAKDNENVNNALKLAYVNGGFINADSLVASQKILLDLEYYVARYKKDVDDSTRKSEIKIELIAADGSTVVKVIEPEINLFKADKITTNNGVDTPVKQTLTLELDTGDKSKLASYVRVTVKTSTNATLYVEKVVLTSNDPSVTPPGPDSGSSAI